MMQPLSALSQSALGERLPVGDALLEAGDLDLDGLAEHWLAYSRRRPVSSEQMRLTDLRAQRMGKPAAELMGQAGAAVAAAARAVLNTYARSRTAPLLILAGSGNNGGDALVAARTLAAAGLRCVVVLVGTAAGPRTAEARAAWRALDGLAGVEQMHAADTHDVAVIGAGIERAAMVIDGLLGTGVRGALREPISAAVGLCLKARRAGVPVLAIDTPTAVDLTSGLPSVPVVRANATVTFHRPKEGLLNKSGSRFCGRVLVAPIGIPTAADMGGSG